MKSTGVLRAALLCLCLPPVVAIGQAEESSWADHLLNQRFDQALAVKTDSLELSGGQEGQEGQSSYLCITCPEALGWVRKRRFAATRDCLT